MSSSAQPEGSLPKAEKEKKGIGKVFSKVKGVWRRGDSAGSKRQSPAVATSAAVNVSDVAAPVTITEPRVEDAPKSYV